MRQDGRAAGEGGQRRRCAASEARWADQLAAQGALLEAAMLTIDGVWDGSAGAQALWEGAGGGRLRCTMTLPRSMGLSPELMELRGHSDQVYAVAYSPDGSRLASGSDDKTVRVWEAATGEAVQTLQGHSDMCDQDASPWVRDGRVIYKQHLGKI